MYINLFALLFYFILIQYNVLTVKIETFSDNKFKFKCKFISNETNRKMECKFNTVGYIGMATFYRTVAIADPLEQYVYKHMRFISGALVGEFIASKRKYKCHCKSDTNKKIFVFPIKDSPVKFVEPDRIKFVNKSYLSEIKWLCEIGTNRFLFPNTKVGAPTQFFSEITVQNDSLIFSFVSTNYTKCGVLFKNRSFTVPIPSDRIFTIAKRDSLRKYFCFFKTLQRSSSIVWKCKFGRIKVVLGKNPIPSDLSRAYSYFYKHLNVNFNILTMSYEVLNETINCQCTYKGSTRKTDLPKMLSLKLSKVNSSLYKCGKSPTKGFILTKVLCNFNGTFTELKKSNVIFTDSLFTYVYKQLVVTNNHLKVPYIFLNSDIKCFCRKLNVNSNVVSLPKRPRLDIFERKNTYYCMIKKEINVQFTWQLTEGVNTCSLQSDCIRSKKLINLVPGLKVKNNSVHIYYFSLKHEVKISCNHKKTSSDDLWLPKRPTHLNITLNPEPGIYIGYRNKFEITYTPFKPLLFSASQAFFHFNLSDIKTQIILNKATVFTNEITAGFYQLVVVFQSKTENITMTYIANYGFYFNRNHLIIKPYRLTNENFSECHLSNYMDRMYFFEWKCVHNEEEISSWKPLNRSSNKLILLFEGITFSSDAPYGVVAKYAKPDALIICTCYAWNTLNESLLYYQSFKKSGYPIVFASFFQFQSIQHVDKTLLFIYTMMWLLSYVIVFTVSSIVYNHNIKLENYILFLEENLYLDDNTTYDKENNYPNFYICMEIPENKEDIERAVFLLNRLNVLKKLIKEKETELENTWDNDKFAEVNYHLLSLYMISGISNKKYFDHEMKQQIIKETATIDSTKNETIQSKLLKLQKNKINIKINKDIAPKRPQQETNFLVRRGLHSNKGLPRQTIFDPIVLGRPSIIPKTSMYRKQSIRQSFHENMLNDVLKLTQNVVPSKSKSSDEVEKEKHGAKHVINNPGTDSSDEVEKHGAKHIVINNPGTDTGKGRSYTLAERTIEEPKFSKNLSMYFNKPQSVLLPQDRQISSLRYSKFYGTGPEITNTGKKYSKFYSSTDAPYDRISRKTMKSSTLNSMPKTWLDENEKTFDHNFLKNTFSKTDKKKSNMEKKSVVVSKYRKSRKTTTTGPKSVLQSMYLANERLSTTWKSNENLVVDSFSKYYNSQELSDIDDDDINDVSMFYRFTDQANNIQRMSSFSPVQESLDDFVKLQAISEEIHNSYDNSIEINTRTISPIPHKFNKFSEKFKTKVVSSISKMWNPN